MARVKIKSLGDMVATAGLHLGGGHERRKLQPGEVVDIPEDFLLEDGRNLLEIAMATGKVELTLDMPTRPLDYTNSREAKLCAPGFKPRDENEERELSSALEAVAQRMAAIPTAKPDTSPSTKPDAPPARNRRAQRRAVAAQAARNVSEVPT